MKTTTRLFAVITLFATLLSGCGGSTGQTSNTSTSSEETEFNETQTIGSGVSDKLDTANDSGITPRALDVSLSWQGPLQRENGDSLQLSELSGYEVIYTNVDLKTTETVFIDDPTASSITLENLRPGNYAFKIAAVDTEGLYSSFTTSVFQLTL